MNVIVLHHIGEPSGGSEWANAFAAEEIGDVWAPDLPGHGESAAPVGGNYTRLDSVYEIARSVAAGRDLADSVLVGVGRSGWAAMVLAVAGQGCGLVLVDGLGTPWTSQTERGNQRRAALRTIAADAAAMGPSPERGIDPRIAAGLLPHGDEHLVREAAAAIGVPVLLIGADATSAETVAPDFNVGVSVVECAPTPTAVAPHLADWLRRF